MHRPAPFLCSTKTPVSEATADGRTCSRDCEVVRIFQKSIHGRYCRARAEMAPSSNFRAGCDVNESAPRARGLIACVSAHRSSSTKHTSKYFFHLQQWPRYSRLRVIWRSFHVNCTMVSSSTSNSRNSSVFQHAPVHE